MHWAEKCPHNKIHFVNLTEGVVEEVESVEDEFEQINALKLSLVKNGFKITLVVWMRL